MSVSIDGAGSLIGVDQGLNIVGLTTLTGGIILDDSISHIGDADTKIRFPAADTFTVETAGSERLRIEDTGRIGINTTSSKVNGLHVYDKHFALSEGYPITWLQPNSSSSRGRMTVDGGGNYLFQFGSVNEEKIRFKSNGNIGIGTDNPSSDLHVFRSTTASSIIDAAAGDALLTLRNAGNTNWSGINFTRERSTGTNVTGGSIWMPSDTSNNSAILYLQTQSASANAGESGALTDNNGVRLKLASQPGGNGGNSAFTVEVGSAERLRIGSSGTLESYSPDDTTPNIRWRSDDTNWFGALNQSVHGGTITSFLSCGGDWSANGTTYSATKALAAYPTSAIAVHNQYNSSWGSQFVFLTKAGGSSTTDGAVAERLRIDSAGRVTKPSQPSFHATNTTIGQINTDGYGTIVFNNVTNNGNHNIGNHYNASTGVFTAPIAGRYLICARSLTNSTANSNPYVSIYVLLNGSVIGYLGHNHTDSWIMESYSGVLSLAANDTVSISVDQASAHGFQNYSSFSGHLLS